MLHQDKIFVTLINLYVDLNMYDDLVIFGFVKHDIILNRRIVFFIIIAFWTILVGFLLIFYDVLGEFLFGLQRI